MVVSGTKVIIFCGNYGYLWYQGYRFCIAIMVASGTKIMNIPEVNLFISATSVTGISMVTISHIFKSLLSQEFCY